MPSLLAETETDKSSSYSDDDNDTGIPDEAMEGDSDPLLSQSRLTLQEYMDAFPQYYYKKPERMTVWDYIAMPHRKSMAYFRRLKVCVCVCKEERVCVFVRGGEERCACVRRDV